jgi:hypothetical protein
MEEKNMSEQSKEENINWKGNSVLGLRFIQVFAIGLASVGFIWGIGDFISSLIPESSVIAPFSIMLILYGAIVSLMVEVPIRLIKRKK